MHKYIIIGLLFIIVFAILMIDNQYMQTQTQTQAQNGKEHFSTSVEVSCDDVKTNVSKNHTNVFGPVGLNLALIQIKSRFSNLGGINSSVNKLRSGLNLISTNIKKTEDAEKKYS
jgi:hypothetical protein